jgi:hypothetical protein
MRSMMMFKSSGRSRKSSVPLLLFRCVSFFLIGVSECGFVGGGERDVSAFHDGARHVKGFF